MMHGFHGRLLHLDLTSGQSVWREIETSRLRAFLGGIGLGTSLLYDYAPRGVDPFSPENPLIFASAPLVGTGLTTTAKFAVVTKSPLTGFIADSLSSSYFALELKRIGDKSRERRFGHDGEFCRSRKTSAYQWRA